MKMVDKEKEAYYKERPDNDEYYDRGIYDGGLDPKIKKIEAEYGRMSDETKKRLRKLLYQTYGDNPDLSNFWF